MTKCRYGLFLALLVFFGGAVSSGNRFHSVAKATGETPNTCGPNSQPGHCLRQTAARYARCEAVKAGLRGLGSGM
jgi:hypothetical protein